MVSTQEQLLRRNVKRLLGGLVFKARRLVYRLSLGSKVIKKKKKGFVRGPGREDRGEDREKLLRRHEAIVVKVHC